MKEHARIENRTAKRAAMDALALGPAAVQKAITDSSDRMGRLGAGVAQAAATVPSKIQVIAGGAAATESVKDREAGKTEYLKSAEDLNNAKAAQDNVSSFINLAKSGNKSAASNLPLLSVEALNAAQNIKRLNRTEIATNKEAGSAYDNIVGWLGKAAVGQPIPKNILDNMQTMHETLLSGAVKKHNLNVRSINGTRGTQFPEEPAPQTSGTIRARDPQGKLHEAPAGTALPAGWKQE